MPYIKFNTIENHYQNKVILNALNRHPELKYEKYLITEKLHGSNLQTIIDLDKPIQLASKNKVLQPNDSFYDVFNTVKQVEHVYNGLQTYGQVHGVNINVYQELFGSGVQTEIKYFESKKSIRFIAIRLDGVLQPPKVMFDIFDEMGCLEWLVPAYPFACGLKEALDFDIYKPSNFTPNNPTNLIEGVVIQPYYKVFFTYEDDQPFILKKKNKKFVESCRTKKPPVPLNGKIVEINGAFQTYINENRLNNIFSKYGPIESPRQIGDYIKYMLEDAKEDFFKEQELDLDAFTKKEVGCIFNVSSKIANMLKKRL